MPPRRGADTARIGDDDDDGPARRLLPNPHIPTSPCRVMSLRQPLSSRRCTCRRARRAPWQILVRSVTFVVRVGTAILNSSRNHCRGIVRRAARKFKFHVEGVLARGRRAEKPPFARVLPRPTHQTSRCDAGVNRDERQTIDTTPPRGVTAVVVHGARRGVVAMANRRTPKIPQMRACHVTQPHVRTMPSNVRCRGHGVRRRRSAVRHRDGAACTTTRRTTTVAVMVAFMVTVTVVASVRVVRGRVI